MGFKLNWKVEKNPDGSFVRRVMSGDSLGLGLEAIDVEWTHSSGFLPETIMVPVSHPPDILYEKKYLPARTVVKDQLSVPPSVADSTICVMLDEKRVKLAKALGVEV